MPNNPKSPAIILTSQLERMIRRLDQMQKLPPQQAKQLAVSLAMEARTTLNQVWNANTGAQQ